MDVNTVAMIIQTRMSKMIPSSNTRVCLRPNSDPNDTMLFSRDNMPTICEIAPRLFIVKNKEARTLESAIGTALFRSVEIDVKGRKTWEFAKTTMNMIVRKVIGVLRYDVAENLTLRLEIIRKKKIGAKTTLTTSINKALIKRPNEYS